MENKNSEILAPISIGELVDKITILEIKSSKIKNKDKLDNISNELKALTNICTNHEINFNDDLSNKLRSINLELWEIEDKIRLKEKVNEFDDGFIKLARDVYFTNDKRFETKAKINKKQGSAFMEEKSYEEYE